MLSSIKEKYDDELELAKNIFYYHVDEKLFSVGIAQFNKSALKAYIVLCTHFSQQHPEILNNLRIMLTPEQFLDKLNSSHRLIETERQLNKYLVDVFEVIVTINGCIDDENFRQICWLYLNNALKNESSAVISIYLQMFHRLDRISTTGIPLKLLQKIAEAVHGPISDSQIFTEVVLLIESSVQKQHNLGIPNTKAAPLLQFLWDDLCSSNIMKHQCEKCYAITSQLIDIYLKECRVNPQFRSKFLTGDLWSFIRTAIESKEVIRRKQAIFMLQQILEADSLEEVCIATIQQSPGNRPNVKTIWKNYFTVLESLLEIQCQLILSCLEQYLDGIVKHLPSFWYTSVFALILQHHNNVVVHYGIEFVLKHQINLQYDNNLMTVFLVALNNTYMFTEVKFSEEEFANLFRSLSINHLLSSMNQITWRPIPLWSIIASMNVYIEKTKGTGIQVPLLFEFLKRSIRNIKDMPNIDKCLVNILENIGFEQFTLEQLLTLHEILPTGKLFAGYKHSLDLQSFEHKLIKLNQINPTTKIAYFRQAIPNVNERLRLLDSFYENNLNRIVYYPDYEFLLFDSLCMNRPLIEYGSSALLVLKPRLYNIIKLQGGVSIESVLFASALLRFIVEEHLNVDCAEFMIFDAIKKVLNNFYVFFVKVSEGSTDKMKLNTIRDHLTVVSGKLIRCTELYSNRMEVLGILRDITVLEGQIPDLKRFSYKNDDDVRLVQSLYDCFIDEEELKLSHQAKVIARMLSDFPNLEADIWHAYKILLNAETDVSCIFKLTHPGCVDEMNKVLVHALIYGEEIKGEEKQEYDFKASKSNSTTYIQKVRLTAMRTISQRNDLAQIRNLKDLLFAKNMEIYRLRYYTHSHHHTMKLRLAQAFSFLFRLDPNWDERLFKMVMDEANQVNVTHINELIIAETANAYHLLELVEKIDGNKGLQSMFVILYYICCKQPEQQFIRKCIEFLTRFIFAKQIMVRTASQIVLTKLFERFDSENEYKTIYDCIKRAHSTKLSRALKYAYAYEYRFTQIDTNNLLHSMYILREIPRITKMSSDEYYKDEIFDVENPAMMIQINENEIPEIPIDSVEVDLCFMENAEETVNPMNANVQRKVVTYRETFIDRKILSSLPEEFSPKNAKSELIILSSFLSKSANLGGLSRSAEVFGVKAIAIDNLKFLRQPEFTTLSMAAEKWLKYFEVKDYNIITYLMAMKSNGYAIVGAEQTAFGQKLHKILLPKKMVLVMGHEKNGIPANVLNLLDMAIEIPQFGVIRSLNVHVTASLFMWEYCKQHLLTNIESPTIAC